MVVAPPIDKCINPCAAVVVEEEKPSYLPINRHDFVRANERVVENKREIHEERKRE
jgi:hypothetical protein